MKGKNVKKEKKSKEKQVLIYLFSRQLLISMTAIP